MKVLIIDDENHVIQAIRLLVPWEELGIDRIFTAASGAEALMTINQETPEIVITDIIMEDMNGVAIMNFIASRYPATKVIAVSGHNDFEYVRAMLTKGCMDYLLKPLESAPLIATIRKVVESWNDEHESSLQNRHLIEKVYSLSDFYAGAQLCKMIKSRDWPGAYQKLLQSDARFVPISTCKILYYNTGFFPMHNAGFVVLHQSFEEQLRQLMRTGNAPTLRSESSGKGMLLSNPVHPGEVILFLYESEESLANSIFRLARSVFCGRPYPFHMGSSKKKSFPGEFPEAFHQAKYAFLSTYGDRDCTAMAIASFPAAGKPDVTLSSEKLQKIETQIFSALLSGHKQDLEAAVFRWVNNGLPGKDITLFQIQHAMDLFQELIKQWMIQIKKQNQTFSYELPEHLLIYEKLIDENFQFSKTIFIQTILMHLSGLGDKLNENQSTAGLMLQIAQYMELNYAEPFVQSEYAKRFSLNKDYMSRKFTTTFGVNMLAYLHQIRVCHARELLGDASLKIQDIALAVGFGDEKYFSRQFKKLTGFSPSDYRASLRYKKQ